MKPVILDSRLPLGSDENRVQIQPSGFYVTVGVSPTTCMFTCGAQHVNLRLTAQEAKYFGEWLLEQAGE